MATINIRDLPDSLLPAINRAAQTADRSREALLRELIVRRFGPEGSATAAITSRAAEAVDEAATLGDVGALAPAPNLARIARALGHSDTSVIEAELAGDRPLSFATGDGLCRLFGLSRSWLEGGEDQKYATRARFHDCEQLLWDFLEHGIPYDTLYFVLADDVAGSAMIIGHHEPADDESVQAWQYDILVDVIPIHDQVGGTGMGQRRDFATLMVALYDLDNNNFQKCVNLGGRIVPNAHYLATVNGLVHPATCVATFSRLAGASTVASQSHWYEDFWSFGRRETYTQGYQLGRRALFDDLREKGVTSQEQLTEYVRKVVGELREAIRNSRKKRSSPVARIQ